RTSFTIQHGTEVAYSTALGRRHAGEARTLRADRHRMVGPRHDHAGGSDDRWRRDLDGRETPDAGAATRAHAIQLVVEMGRRRSADRIALRRRYRLHAA